MWQCGSALVKGGRSSDLAVEQFHRKLNSERFEEIYTQADHAFQESGKQEEILKFFGAIHKKLGNAGRADRGTIKINTNTNGTFIAVTYTTVYERGTATETFTWRKDVADNLKLVGYNIQSNALITQ